ncbi:hypothetical protein HK102_001179 [Quaeritorhiza haematococci]|nr:hypothetical protein HK102_001179 [Quaeritorhiza haematococci]
MAVQIFIHGRGTINPTALREAVTKASHLVPGSRLVLRGKSWIDSGNPPPVRVIYTDTFDGHTFTPDTTPFVFKNLDPVKGPTCEVVLLRCMASDTVLLFRAFHGVMDGKGVLMWIDHVFRLMNGQASGLERLESTETDLMLVKRLVPKHKRTAQFNACSPFPDGIVPGVGVDEGEGHGSSGGAIYRRRTINGTHQGLVAKLADIIKEWSGPATGNLRFLIPVDMRRHQGAHKSTANLSLPIFLDVAKEDTWESLQERLMMGLAEDKELAVDGFESLMQNAPVWFLEGFLRAMAKVGAMTGGCLLASGYLSHLGRLDLKEFETTTFKPSTVYALPAHTPNMPLCIVTTESGGKLEITVSSNKNENAEHITSLLDDLLDTIEVQLPSLERGLSAFRVAKGAFAWSANNTLTPFPEEKTAVQLFAEQVCRSPHAIALVDGDETISYQELAAASDHAARCLQKLDVVPGVIVPIVMNRSVEAIICIWAIMKAGAAFLPVDPDYPDERVAYMLHDSDARLCITHDHLIDRVAELFTGDILIAEQITQPLPPSPTHSRHPSVNAPPNRWSSYSSTSSVASSFSSWSSSSFNSINSINNTPLTPDSARCSFFSTLSNIATPCDVAYVIYTSGSTGRAKGVLVEHRSLVNYIHYARSAYKITPESRFALFTSLSFDLTITSCILPLLCGGSIAVIKEDILKPSTIREVLVGCGANCLKLTPTHLELFERMAPVVLDDVEGVNGKGVEGLGFQLLVLGGEQLRISTCQRSLKLFGSNCRIVNEYGPTEATVGCIMHVFDPIKDALESSSAASSEDPTQPGKSDVVPIGVPMNNCQIYLLNPDTLTPVAPGQSGEIFIAGDVLARGYFNRPDLNAQRFITLPYTDTTKNRRGVRAYRTGDLARLIRHGEVSGRYPYTGILQYLGRNDEQVKINGFRIEPAEIASAIEQLSFIDRALVIARQLPASSGRSEKRLCAYFVVRENGGAEDESSMDDAALASIVTKYLKENLPRHMIPSFLARVPSIPLTVNGKADTRKLPDIPAMIQSTGTNTTTSPSSSSSTTPTDSHQSHLDTTAPLDTTESQIADVWARILNIDAASINLMSNFYDLGGDSLAMVQMFAGVVKAFGGRGRGKGSLWGM